MVARRSSLASDAFSVSIGAAALHTAALLSTMVLARLLEPAELGGYQQLFLLYGIVSPLLLSGIPAALLFFLPQTEERRERRAWVGTAYVLVVVSGLLFGGAVALLRHPLAELLNDPDVAGLLLLWAPYPLLLFIASVMPNVLVPIGRAGTAGLLNVLSATLFLVGVVVGAAVGGDAESAVVGMLCAGALSAVISVTVVSRAVGAVRPWATRERTRRMLAYGVPLALTGLAGMLGYQLDRLVVSARFTPAEYAVYALGAVELPVAVLVQQSVNNVLAPALTRAWKAGDKAGMVALWQEAIRGVSLILLPVFAVCMVLSGDIVEVLFGSRYEESTSVFRIYLLLVPLRVATYGLIPMAIGRTRMNLTASLFLLVTNLVLVLSLIGPLGLEGAAAAAVGSTFLMAGYYLVRLTPLLGTTFGALFPWRMLGVHFALSLLAAAPVALLLEVDLPAVVRLVVGGAVYAGFYLVVMRLTRRITDQDWARLMARLPSRRS